MSELEWYPDDDEGHAFSALWGPITVAKIRYAAAGEAEGGLGLLMRYLAGAAGAAQPPPSPAGWYWSEAVTTRGVWTGWRRAESVDAAKREIERAAAVGYWTREGRKNL